MHGQVGTALARAASADRGRRAARAYCWGSRQACCFHRDRQSGLWGMRDARAHENVTVAPCAESKLNHTTPCKCLTAGAANAQATSQRVANRGSARAADLGVGVNLAHACGTNERDAEKVLGRLQVGIAG